METSSINAPLKLENEKYIRTLTNLNVHISVFILSQNNNTIIICTPKFWKDVVIFKKLKESMAQTF